MQSVASLSTTSTADSASCCDLGSHFKHTPFSFCPLRRDTMCKNNVIRTAGNTWHITTPPEEDRPTAISNMQKIGAKIGPVDPEIWWRTDKHSDRQTDRQTWSSEYSAPLLGAKYLVVDTSLRQLTLCLTILSLLALTLTLIYLFTQCAVCNQK